MRLHKLFSVMVCALVLATSCKGHKQADSTEAGDTYYLAYDRNFHNEIIKPEVLAWQKVARVIYPRVCDDTETQWAASLADSLCTALLKQPTLSNGEQLAKLYQIQNTIAYGMSYFVAVMGNASNPESSWKARTIIERSDNEMDSLKSVDFNDPRMLIAFEQSTFDNFGLFIELALGSPDDEPRLVADNHELSSANIQAVISLFSSLSDSTQAYRYSSIVCNNTFIKTIFQLTYVLVGPDFLQTNVREYQKICDLADNQLKEVNEAFANNDIARLPQMSLKDFTKIEKQASANRVRMVELLKEAILVLPE